MGRFGAIINGGVAHIKCYASPYANSAKNEQTDKNENRKPKLRKIKRGASQHKKPTLLHHI